MYVSLCKFLETLMRSCKQILFCTAQVFYVKWLNPFVSKPPIVTNADPFPFLPLVMSPVFNSKDNFVIWHLQGEEIELSNHARMSMIFSRRREKKAKCHLKFTWKFHWKKLKIERTVSFSNRIEQRIVALRNDSYKTTERIIFHKPTIPPCLTRIFLIFPATQEMLET